MPILSVIAASVNSPEWAELLVKSIRKFTMLPHETIIVDNGSSIANLAWLRQQSDVILVENGENRGHGGAMDQGVRRASGQYVCVLDIDAHVQREGWDRDLIALYHADPKTRLVGIIGPEVKPLHPPLFFFERDFFINSGISWSHRPATSRPKDTDTAQQAYWDILALGYEVLRLPKGAKIYEGFIGDEIWIAGQPTIAHMWYGTRFQENGIQPKLELDGYKLVDHLENKRRLFAQPLVREILREKLCLIEPRSS